MWYSNRFIHISNISFLKQFLYMKNKMLILLTKQWIKLVVVLKLVVHCTKRHSAVVAIDKVLIGLRIWCYCQHNNRTVNKFGRGAQMGRTVHVAARNCSCHTAPLASRMLHAARAHHIAVFRGRPSRLDAINAHLGANVLPMQFFAYDFAINDRLKYQT